MLPSPAVCSRLQRNPRRARPIPSRHSCLHDRLQGGCASMSLGMYQSISQRRSASPSCSAGPAAPARLWRVARPVGLAVGPADPSRHGSAQPLAGTYSNGVTPCSPWLSGCRRRSPRRSPAGQGPHCDTPARPGPAQRPGPVVACTVLTGPASRARCSMRGSGRRAGLGRANGDAGVGRTGPALSARTGRHEFCPASSAA
jgi:hypothetical protein